MNRREFVLRTAGAFSTLSISPAFAEIVANYPSSARGGILDKPQMALLQALVDCIIPDTDTPGASAAGVQEFIHYLLGKWYAPDKHARFARGLTALNEHAVGKYGSAFIACNSKQREQLLTDLEALHQSPEQKSELTEFVVWVKELTVLGYYTSEVGASQELNYLAIPGPYSGCIDFAEVGRTWAT
ncbi:MAG: gluconate 2-dehydrogenase subunit 3 family protein [Halieaceae bacterium]|nr:gluconate 2-dehydrogenase subunit 3 family protein [Halieaceae bacterium]